MKKTYYVGCNRITKKWLYKYESCGVLWEFIYPYFPALGQAKKFHFGEDYEKNIIC